MSELAKIIEAIIFVSHQPVSISFIQEILKTGLASAEEETEASSEEEIAGEEQIREALSEIKEKFEPEEHAFELKEVANGFQFFTKRDYFIYAKKAALQYNKKRLSRASLETLSIIAYRQPVTKSEVEFIRGVSCDYAIQKLLDKKLISITGRSDSPGRPLLYGTSPYFMQYFGMKEMGDLPKLKEFEELEDEHLEKFRMHQEAAQEDQNNTEGEIETIKQHQHGQEAGTPGTLLEGSEEGISKEEGSQENQ